MEITVYFGENVKIYDHNHIFKDKNVPIKNQGFKMSEIIIDDDCWVGTNTVILKNVYIGKHVVMSAGEVIRKNIFDNSVFCEKNISKIY